MNIAPETDTSRSVSLLMALSTGVFAIAIFAIGVYIYIYSNIDTVASDSAEAVVLSEQVQEGAHATDSKEADVKVSGAVDQTIVREDGVTVHVGECPFESGCDGTDMYTYVTGTFTVFDGKVLHYKKEDSLSDRLDVADNVSIVSVDAEGEAVVLNDTQDFMEGDKIHLTYNAAGALVSIAHFTLSK